jgi:hypothetical protein
VRRHRRTYCRQFLFYFAIDLVLGKLGRYANRILDGIGIRRSMGN